MKWFKNINTKGFTLIELLAVIVILSIILVIVVPRIFDTIDNSKTKSLEISVKNLTSSWEKDLISSQLNGISSKLGEVTENFRCITINEANALDISRRDYLINPTSGVCNLNGCISSGAGKCSKVKKDSSGKIIVVLYANPQGSIYTLKSAMSGDMFVSSTGDSSKKLIPKYETMKTLAKNTVKNLVVNGSDVTIGREVIDLKTSWTGITISQAETLGL